MTDAANFSARQHWAVTITKPHTFRLRRRRGKVLRDWIEIDDLNAIFR
jgi:hypothetical protein